MHAVLRHHYLIGESFLRSQDNEDEDNDGASVLCCVFLKGFC